MDNLGLQGYVPASGRGTVTGSYSGTLSGQPVTLGFKVRIADTLTTFYIHSFTQNSAAQYWIAGSGWALATP
jgi:rhamnogalacturonan endolyase